MRLRHGLAPRRVRQLSLVGEAGGRRHPHFQSLSRPLGNKYRITYGVAAAASALKLSTRYVLV